MNRVFVGLVIFLAVSLPRSANAQSEMKLFSSPQMRLELERRRLGLVDTEPAPVAAVIDVITSLIDDEEAEEIIYSLEGTLLKQDGSSILWLNGTAVNESELPDGVSVVKPASLGQVSFLTSDGEFVIKPGQVLNASAGMVYEAYEWSEILEQRRLLELAKAAEEAGRSVANDTLTTP